MNSAEEISKILKESGISITELSARAGLSRATLYDVMKGRFRLKPESLERLLSVLEISENQMKYLVEKAIEERREARMVRPGAKGSEKEAQHFAQELVGRISELGISVSQSDQNVDFVITYGGEKVPVIVKISVIQPERFFAPIMQAKLDYGSSWAVVVTPFSPSKHRYEHLFMHHSVKWLDGQSFVNLLGNKGHSR